MKLDTSTTTTPGDCTSPHSIPCYDNHASLMTKHVSSASTHRIVSPTIESMTDHCSPQLELPYAELHVHTQREPHVDSEEAVQYERRRVSRELESIYHQDASQQSSQAPHTSLRSRNASLHNASASHERLRSDASHESDADTAPDASERAARSTRSSIRIPHWHSPITKFWSTHVSITIDEGAHRDHLALERTFLGYLRTSLLLVMTGVLTAQLFRLQHAANPNARLGFYVIGRPLSITFIGTGILVVVVGACRFWKIQRGLVRGKAHTGGWEVLLLMGLSVLLLVVTFALVLGVNIEKAMEGN